MARGPQVGPRCAGPPIRDTQRERRCAFTFVPHNPCQARWTAAKYGLAGAPAHMQRITCMGPAAAPVLPLHAAAPLEAEDVEEGTAVAGTASAPTSAAAAQHRVQAAVLRLAREIRRPSAYLGYIAFVLFALCRACRPYVWEGAVHMDLLQVFAPWAIPQCPADCAVAALPCALVGRAGGVIECVPISEEVPLHRTVHYVAGVTIPPQSRAEGDPVTFESFYAELGVSTLPTVCDGDCGVDVMMMMQGAVSHVASRNQLRVELSDYLMERIHTPWMLELLCLAQELDQDEVRLACSCSSPFPSLSATGVGEARGALLPTVSTAVAADATEDDDEAEEPKSVDPETVLAMRWASGLEQDSTVLALTRSLPHSVIDEQVALYRARDTAAVAGAKRTEGKVKLSQVRTHQQRMSVALRLHRYCTARGILAEKKCHMDR